MMNERRCYKSRGVDTSVELRAAADGSKSLVGAAAVFKRYSQNLGGFVEVLAPEAFTPALQRGSNVAGLVNHDPSWLLATTGSGTLSLAQDDEAFRYVMGLDMTDPDAQRAAAKIGTGKMPGSSFSFRVAPGGDSWSQTDQGFPLRTIRSIDELFDVGPVTFPAYLDTQGDTAATALRSLAEQIDRPLEDLVAAARSNELRSFIPPARKLFTVPEMRTKEQADPRSDAKARALVKAEKRAAPPGERSWYDVIEAVWSAIEAATGEWICIEDIAADWVVFCTYPEDAYFQMSWSMDDMGAVTLGDPIAVVETYLPVTDPASAGPTTAVPDTQGMGVGLPTRSAPAATGRTAYLERRAALDALA